MQWHGVPVLPRTRKALEALLRKLAPAVFLLEENGRRGPCMMDAPDRAVSDNKEQTPLPPFA